MTFVASGCCCGVGRHSSFETAFCRFVASRFTVQLAPSQVWTENFWFDKKERELFIRARCSEALLGFAHVEEHRIETFPRNQIISASFLEEA